MKKKIYIRISILFFVLFLATGFYCLRMVGFFNKNQILVKAIACRECASYEVVNGSSKMSSQLQGPADSVNIQQVYIIGEPNPFASDYTMTFDYYLTTGKVTGLQKAANSGMIFPVITASTWEHFNPSLEWVLIIFALVFFIVSLRYFVKFRRANQPDATKSALLTHSNPPIKNH